MKLLNQSLTTSENENLDCMVYENIREEMAY